MEEVHDHPDLFLRLVVAYISVCIEVAAIASPSFLVFVPVLGDVCGDVLELFNGGIDLLYDLSLLSYKTLQQRIRAVYCLYNV